MFTRNGRVATSHGGYLEVSDPAVAARGYVLGAQLLQFLAPQSGQETYTVPVDVAPGERVVTDGVLDRDAIVRQTEARWPF